MKKFFILCLLILSGCAGSSSAHYRYVNFTPAVGVPEHVVPIWVDKNFSGMDMDAIDNSISEWNYVLNGHVHLEVVSRRFDMTIAELKRIDGMGGWAVMKIDSSNPAIKDKNWLAYCDHVSGHYMYIIKDRMRDKDVQRIALHEFGHLLGSEHVGTRVMYKYYTWGRYACVDWEVAREVAIHWNLTPDRLNSCVPIAN